MHKLRALIDEPKAFFPEHVMLSGCLFRLQMFMWFTDLNKGMLNHRPKKSNRASVAAFTSHRPRRRAQPAEPSPVEAAKLREWDASKRAESVEHERIEHGPRSVHVE